MSIKVLTKTSITRFEKLKALTETAAGNNFHTFSFCKSSSFIIASELKLISPKVHKNPRRNIEMDISDANMLEGGKANC